MRVLSSNIGSLEGHFEVIAGIDAEIKCIQEAKLYEHTLPNMRSRCKLMEHEIVPGRSLPRVNQKGGVATNKLRQTETATVVGARYFFRSANR